MATGDLFQTSFSGIALLCVSHVLKRNLAMSFLHLSACVTLLKFQRCGLEVTIIHELIAAILHHTRISTVFGWTMAKRKISRINISQCEWSINHILSTLSSTPKATKTLFLWIRCIRHFLGCSRSNYFNKKGEIEKFRKATFMQGMFQ